MEWVLVESFSASSPEARKEKQKWEYIAEDLALVPESNVRLVEDEGSARVEISKYLHDYFQDRSLS
ncbi:MAG: hypothetical protein SVS15_02295 [Thermodesulfobacteriota bacterium]|nr:hypothetical protein [Thermodesulfobacteriota bacterium]